MATKSTGPRARNLKQQKAAPSNAATANRAYEIWLAEGQQPGCDEKNWFEAEEQLRTRKQP